MVVVGVGIVTASILDERALQVGVAVVDPGVEHGDDGVRRAARHAPGGGA